MSHNNTTHNSNNNYSVEIIVDPDLSGGSGSVVKYSSLTNSPFYELKIIPPHSGVPVLAGNIRIDGIDSDWSYITNLHPYGSTSCTPHPTPHGISSQIAHTYMFGPGGTSCYATPQFNNGSYDFQGPYTFTNDAYTNGAFLTDSNPVTWSKIHLIEVYNNDSGGFDNDTLSPEIAENEKTWNTWNTSKSSITLSPYPMYLKAFVYVVYDPNINIGNGNSLSLTLDIDEVAPVAGCTDPLASNYDSTVTIDDGSCTYPPASKTIYVTNAGIVHSGPLTGYTDPPFASEVPSNDGFSPSTMDLNGEPNMPKNLYIPNSLPLANTYMPGDFVTEIVSVVVTPRAADVLTGNFQTINGIQIPIIESAIAAFDFPLPNGPDNQDMTNPVSFLGDAANNLTAAGLYIENISTTTGSAIGRNTYVANGTSGLNSSNISQQPSWMPDAGFLDEDGLFPRTICDWDVNDIEFIQPDGTIFIADIDGLWVEEQYMTGSPLVPGLEWFPFRLNMYMVVEFTMPNHDVYLNLDLRHDTQRLVQN
mgnify:FL=1